MAPMTLGAVNVLHQCHRFLIVREMLPGVYKCFPGVFTGASSFFRQRFHLATLCRILSMLWAHWRTGLYICAADIVSSPPESAGP